MRNSSPKPVSRLSSSASTASNVESREVTPVPPVRMNASTAGSAQPFRITAVTWVGSSRLLDVDRAVRDGGGIARDVLAGHRHAGARAHVELPAVDRADHDVALHPACAEAPALVRAVVADGQHLVAAAKERDVLAVDGDERALPRDELGGVGDLHAGHGTSPP